MSIIKKILNIFYMPIHMFLPIFMNIINCFPAKMLLTNNVITKLSQPCQFCRTIGRNIQNVPNIFIRSLKTTKPVKSTNVSIIIPISTTSQPDGDAKKPLSSPQSAGCYKQLSHCSTFATVHCHTNLLFYIGL